MDVSTLSSTRPSDEEHVCDMPQRTVLGSGMNWEDPDAIQLLRRLWLEGTPTAEIGRQLGCSTNAAIGKAHRLRLPVRPSPIRRGATPDDSPAKPKLRATDLAPPLPAVKPIRATQRAPQRAPARAKVVVPVLICGRVLQCAWPVGDPKARNFHFCDHNTEPGRPYCADHILIAYRAVLDDVNAS